MYCQCIFLQEVSYKYRTLTALRFHKKLDIQQHDVQTTKSGWHSMERLIADRPAKKKPSPAFMSPHFGLLPPFNNTKTHPVAS